MARRSAAKMALLATVMVAASMVPRIAAQFTNMAAAAASPYTVLPTVAVTVPLQYADMALIKNPAIPSTYVSANTCNALTDGNAAYYIRFTATSQGTIRVTSTNCGATSGGVGDNIMSLYNALTFQQPSAQSQCIVFVDNGVDGISACAGFDYQVQANAQYYLLVQARAANTILLAQTISIQYTQSSGGGSGGTGGACSAPPSAVPAFSPSAAAANIWLLGASQCMYIAYSGINLQAPPGGVTDSAGGSKTSGKYAIYAVVRANLQAGQIAFLKVSTTGCKGPNNLDPAPGGAGDPVMSIYDYNNYGNALALGSADDNPEAVPPNISPDRCPVLGQVPVAAGGTYLIVVSYANSAYPTLPLLPLRVEYFGGLPAPTPAPGNTNNVATPATYGVNVATAPTWVFTSSASVAIATWAGVNINSAVNERNTGPCTPFNIPGVWVKLQFTVPGTVSISTDGCNALAPNTDRDTVLAVYSANNYQTTQCLLGNDNLGTFPAITSYCAQGSIPVVAGGVYYLMISLAAMAAASSSTAAFVPINIQYTNTVNPSPTLPTVSGTNVAVAGTLPAYNPSAAFIWTLSTGLYAQITWSNINLVPGGGATNNFGGCSNANKPAVYAKFTTLVAGQVSVSTEGCGAQFSQGPGDNVLTVYDNTGYPNPAVGCVGENLDAASGAGPLCARLTFNAAVGATYVVAISGQGVVTSLPTLPLTVQYVSGGGGTPGVAIDVAPDSFDSQIAYAPASAPYWYIPDNTRKVNVQYRNVNLQLGTLDQGRCIGNEANWQTNGPLLRSIYTKFSVGTAGQVKVSTAGCQGQGAEQPGDNQIMIYTDPYPNPSTAGCVGFDDDSAGSFCGQFIFNAVANQVYWVVISGFNLIMPYIPLDISYTSTPIFYSPPPPISFGFSPPPPAFDNIADTTLPPKDPINQTPWIISSQVRGAVTWNSLNLLDGTYPIDQGLCQRNKQAIMIRVLATETGRIRASLAGCISDQYLTVYDYSQYVVNNQVVALQNNVNCIAQDDNSANPALGVGCPELTFPATAGQSFLVLITGSGGTTFLTKTPIEINWQPASGSVTPSPTPGGLPTIAYSKGTAQLVTVGASPVIFFWYNVNLNGTSGYDEGACMYAKPAAWFKVNTAQTGLFQISTFGCTSAGANGGPTPVFNGPGDNVLAVYNIATYPPNGQTGQSCLAFNNDFGGSLCATVQFQATAGFNYYVLISSVGPSNSLPYVPFELKYVGTTPPPSPAPPSPPPPSPTPPPPPTGPQPQFNLQAAPTIVVPTGGRQTFQYTNVNLNAVQAATDVAQCGSVGKPAVWLKVVPEASGYLLISTAGCGGSDGGPGDTAVSVYEWAYDVNKPCFAYDENSGGSFCGAATFPVRGSQTYVVLLTGGGNNRIFPVLPVDMYYVQPPSFPPPSPTPPPPPIPSPVPTPSPSTPAGGQDLRWPAQTCKGVFEDISDSPRYTLSAFAVEFQDGRGVGSDVVTRICTNIDVNKCPAGLKKSCCQVPKNVHMTVGPQCDSILKVTATPASTGQATTVNFKTSQVTTDSTRNPYSIQIPTGSWFPTSGRVKICLEVRGSGCNSPAKMCNSFAALPAEENAGISDSPGCAISFENGNTNNAKRRRCCLTTVSG